MGYHLIFTYFAYKIRVERGIADSQLYWFQNEYTQGKSWLDFFKYGTDFILFLNYPFVKLGIPYWGGFLLYGTIGFLGIIQWIRWVKVVVKDTFIIRNTNWLWLVFLWPNLHYWTASLGKEALLFWGIASVFYALVIHRYTSFSFIVGSLLVLIVRPHVAMLLFTAIVLVLFFKKNYSLKRRLFLLSISLLVLLASVYMAFQLSGIRYFNWQRIQYFNEFSIRSFKHSGSYVPMLDYNYCYKLFSFHFRPLFFDAHNVSMMLASLENLIILLLFVLALLIILRYYSRLVFPAWMKITFWFALLATVVYIERYANLGIFMRTKVMFQPFLLIALLQIISQGITLYKVK
ncbi:MAG: hypothetical protein EBS55_06880 [Flavobacteriaceae bacterium]|nr:hypothetical protein [Flavobacteriaceae bacterium]